MHSKSNTTNSKLIAQRRLNEPKQVSIVQCQPQKAVIGKRYKKDSQLVINYLASLTEDQVEEFDRRVTTDGKIELNLDDKQFELTKEDYQIDRKEKMVHVEDVVPNVIEPSFGIGRIMYCLFEHTFKQREDKARTFFSLPPEIAPLKCSILPLISNEQYYEIVDEIKSQLIKLNLSSKVDEGKESIGKRYSRTDELSIPFAITIDGQTLDEKSSGRPLSVTLRERDSMQQIRVSVDELPSIVLNLSVGNVKWNDLKEEKGLVNSRNDGDQ